MWKKIIGVFGSVTVLGVLGFVWSEYKECQDVRPAILQGAATAHVYSGEANSNKSVTLLAKKNRMEGELHTVTRRMHVSQAFRLIGEISDNLCEAYRNATGSNACSRWAESKVSLKSVTRNDWLDALRTAGLPIERSASEALTNELLDAIERLRKLEQSKCVFDHNDVGHTARFIDNEYKQDDNWWAEVRSELESMRARLVVCADALEVTEVGNVDSAKNSSEILEKRRKDLIATMGEIDSELEKTGNRHETPEDVGKIEQGMVECARKFGVCAWINGVVEQCKALRSSSAAQQRAIR